MSVSLQDIWFPPPRPVAANFSRSSSQRQTEGPGAPLNPLNFFHLVQRCHWALSLHLLKSWRRWQTLFLCVWGLGQPSAALPAAKQAQQTVLKDYFFFKRQTAAVPDKSTNKVQWNFVRRVRGFLWERLCRGVGGGSNWDHIKRRARRMRFGDDGLDPKCKVFWALMPVQVAAVEAATSPPPLPLSSDSQWGNCFSGMRAADRERLE